MENLQYFESRLFKVDKHFETSKEQKENKQIGMERVKSLGLFRQAWDLKAKCEINLYKFHINPAHAFDASNRVGSYVTNLQFGSESGRASILKIYRYESAVKAYIFHTFYILI